MSQEDLLQELDNLVGSELKVTLEHILPADESSLPSQC